MLNITEKTKNIKKHFDSIASHYSDELPKYFQDYILIRKMEFIPKYCKNLDEMSGLDIGCGQGKYLNFLNLQSRNMVGIDFSFNNVKNTITQNKFNKHALNSDGGKLPFKSNYFNFCFCINVLHHLPSQELQENCLNEMIRVTREKGTIFIFDLSLKNPLFRLYLKHFFPRIRSIDEGDELFFSEKKIIKLVEKKTHLIGLEFYSFVPDIIPRSILRILMLIERLIEKTIFKRLAMHKVIILKKKKEP